MACGWSSGSHLSGVAGLGLASFARSSSIRAEASIATLVPLLACTPKGSVARLPKRNAAQPERGQEEWPNGVAGFFQALSAPGCRCEGPGTSFFCPHGAGAGALRASSSSRSSQQAWWRGPALTLVEQVCAQQPLGTPLQELRRSLRSGTSLQYSRRGCSSSARGGDRRRRWLSAMANNPSEASPLPIQ